jgi:hypothetical protein
MTVPPIPPTDPDLAAAARDFKEGGWIVSILGGAGTIARLLIEDENHPVRFWFFRIVAGAIVGCICYFALWGTSLSGIQKSIILSTAGAFSPELLIRFKKLFSKGNLTTNEQTKKKRKKRSSSK